MEDWIKKFMDYKGITSSELADTIGVQRSNVTHVLKGRNMPSFQFIQKLLKTYPEINAKWLILGEGNMIDGISKSRTLFDTIQEPLPTIPVVSEKKTELEVVVNPPSLEPKETSLKPPIQEKLEPENKLFDSFFGSEKPIERLIVFFNDQTFKVYNPSR